METNTHRQIPEQPLISVVMPVYNVERYLAESIASIRAQTYSRFEFIIVDDGSNDGSARILREFAAQDARIQPIFAQHGGGPHAANIGVGLARGELISRMDADDVALPQRFAAQLAWMRQTGVDVCGSWVKQFGDQNNLIWFPETHQAICCELFFRVGLLHPTVIFRADILKAHLYDEQTHHDDYEMWTRLAPLYQLGNIPQVLLKHRNHSKQSHVVDTAAFRADFRTFLRKYLDVTYPDATEEDYFTFVSMAEKKPFSDLATLKQAGEWLTRLAQTPDTMLRKRMAGRWRAACQRSSHLGIGCYRLYHQIAPQFGELADQRSPLALWFSCALRLRSGSRLYLALASVKRRIVNLRAAASNSGQRPWLDPEH
jgi:glycosyltransferase involved in cell wall biosynthesis